ncbi:MAG: PAS domain S-box protein, partial [Sphingobacteriales bacterium]
MFTESVSAPRHDLIGMAFGSVPSPVDEYKRLAESFAQATWETDARGLVVTDSPSWRAYTGQTLDEWLGEGWVNAIHPDDRDYALRQWQQAVAGQRPVNAEFRLRSPDGGWRWTNVRARAIETPGGSVQKWVGLNIDISERKRTEEQLALAQNRQQAAELQATRDLLRATLDSSLDLIQVFEAVRDEQGEIVDFTWVLNNHAAETVYGDVINKRLLTLNPGVVAEGIFDTFKRVVETGTPDVSERHYVHEQFNGWFHQSVVKLNDGVKTTTSEITNRKKAEQEIKDQADFISSVMNATSAIISITNPAGDIVFNNRDAFTLLGFDVDEIAQMKREDRMTLVHPDDIVLLRNFYASVDSLEDGMEVTVQFRSKNKSGEYVWLDTRTKLLKRDKAGKAAQFLYITQDITAQKKAEQEILRLKDELAQQATNTYQTLFDSIDQGFNILELMVDEQGKPTDFRILQTNQAWCQQTGLLDATGKTLREITPTFEQSLI